MRCLVHLAWVSVLLTCTGYREGRAQDESNVQELSLLDTSSGTVQPAPQAPGASDQLVDSGAGPGVNGSPSSTPDYPGSMDPQGFSWMNPSTLAAMGLRMEVVNTNQGSVLRLTGDAALIVWLATYLANQNPYGGQWGNPLGNMRVYLPPGYRIDAPVFQVPYPQPPSTQWPNPSPGVQAPAPSRNAPEITKLYPTETYFSRTIIIDGTNLRNATSVLVTDPSGQTRSLPFHHSAFTEHPNPGLYLSINDCSRPGVYKVQVVTPTGISNPNVTFRIKEKPDESDYLGLNYPNAVN